MSETLIERLRNRVKEVYGGHGNVLEVPDALCCEAADALEAAERRISDLEWQLRAADEEIDKLERHP